VQSEQETREKEVVCVTTFDDAFRIVSQGAQGQGVDEYEDAQSVGAPLLPLGSKK
jgi:hypothetical protein